MNNNKNMNNNKRGYRRANRWWKLSALFLKMILEKAFEVNKKY